MLAKMRMLEEGGSAFARKSLRDLGEHGSDGELQTFAQTRTAQNCRECQHRGGQLGVGAHVAAVLGGVWQRRWVAENKKQQ